MAGGGSVVSSALLVLAGAIAGVAGSAGGVTSLVSYPALLAVGLRPVVANVTQSVAFVGMLPGSMLGSRPELKGRARLLLGWAPIAIAGSLVGLVLLLALPPRVFSRVVPFLLVIAALVLLCQPRISAWRQERQHQAGHLLLPCSLFLVSVYNGYFGAGSGVMVLAVMLVLVEPHLARANVLKNTLLGAADLVTAVVFVIFGPVRWWAAAPLFVGLLAGSRVGPVIARRLPAALLRYLVAAAGLSLAVWLWASG